MRKKKKMSPKEIRSKTRLEIESGEGGLVTGSLDLLGRFTFDTKKELRAGEDALLEAPPPKKNLGRGLC